jgi:SNF2 family DNA or RNA helicase
MALAPVIVKSSKEFVIPNDERLAALVPHRGLLFRDTPSMAFPHTVETTRLARNMGHRVPAPILSQYDWDKHDPAPFETQKTTAALLTMNARGYVLSEMGTGKTRAALYACDHMFETREIKRVLVVAPLSTLTQVWDKEIFRYFTHLSTAVIWHQHRKKRIALFEKAMSDGTQILITNHDGVKMLTRALADAKFDVIIVDEVATFRNTQTALWRDMRLVCKNVPYVWGMTGSPMPNEPPDAWGLAKLLTPRRATRYKKEFKRKTMFQVSEFRWVPRPDANDHVYDMLQPAVRFKRDDCVELPEVQYKTIELPPSKQVKDTYENMVKKLKLAFQEGTVTAANEGVLFSKLLQIACGWVYTQDKGIVRLDNNRRVQELLDIYEQAAGKVICFTNFKHSTEELYARVAKKIKCDVVHGGVPIRHRDPIFNNFQDRESKSMLIAHPQCMAHGLTLTAANTIVWFTPTTSLEIYEQANARITRPGQDKKSLIIHLTGLPIESRIYTRLRQKARLQGALLDMFNDN